MVARPVDLEVDYEAARRIVEPALDTAGPRDLYPVGSWGPAERRTCSTPDRSGPTATDLARTTRFLSATRAKGRGVSAPTGPQISGRGRRRC